MKGTSTGQGANEVAMSAAHSLILPDGRVLCYASFGAPAGTERATTFYFNGTPGSHREGQGVDEAARKQRLRVIAVSRPGYGGSTHQPTRTILSFADDVLVLADHLRLRRFGIIGISGGGPYALACMHALPRERLAAVCVVASAYPPELGFAGMQMPNRILMNVAPWLPGLVSYFFDYVMGRAARDLAHPERFPRDLLQAAKSLVPPDRAVMEALDGRFLSLITESARGAFQDGPWGAGYEMRLFGLPWGFDLAGLRVPEGGLVMWHGEKDVNCPAAMAKKAAALIPNAELRLDKDLAHISITFHKLDEFVATMAERLTR